MSRAVHFLFLLFLTSDLSHQILPATQEPSLQGTPVAVTPLDPKRSTPRTPFATGCGIWDQLRVVVRDRDAWADLWNRIHRVDPTRGPYAEPPPLPEIDFSREMLVVAAMGRRGSSGYSIIIDAAYAHERNYRLEIVVRSVESPCGSQLAIMTAPIDIVRLPKTDRTVIFRETEVLSACK